MATISQIRAMFLEEAILYLIVVCGYNAVDYDKDDVTLCLRPFDKALCVKGRGESHQIDAIAEFFLSPPFSYKHRLLIEAKYHNEHVGLPTIRGVVGTLKDVSEFWTAKNISIGRYHYLYAVFSGSDFTSDAQNYAFAQDIHLFSLNKSRYFLGLLQSIARVTHTSFDVRDSNSNISIRMTELRYAIRQKIANPEDDRLSRIGLPREARESLEMACQECRKIQVGLLATINGDFPLFFVPNPSRLIEIAGSAMSGEISSEDVHIRRAQGGGWILQHQGEDFFSFDVPSTMIRRYIEQARSQTGNTVEIQGLLMNLGGRVNSNFGNGMVKVNFKLPRAEIDQLSRAQ